MTWNDSSYLYAFEEECLLNKRRKEQNFRHGRLPASAPLANAYVPFQLENPPMHEARKGLVRGTMYPGLDLPFHGMVNKNEKNVTPMTDLQALAFAVQELALYLDTHRDDTVALEQYRSYQKMAEKCREEYQKKHGPLTHKAPMDCSCYNWLDDPWPWEYCKNQEV